MITRSVMPKKSQRDPNCLSLKNVPALNAAYYETVWKSADDEYSCIRMCATASLVVAGILQCLALLQTQINTLTHTSVQILQM